MSTENALPQKQKSNLGTLEMVLYCAGYAGSGMVNLGVGTYLTFFWTDIFKIPLAAVGTIFLASRILDGVTDIFQGFLIDNTKTKYGKARPWLLWMVAPATISYILLFYTPNFGETARIVWAFIMYNLVAYFFLTAINLPLQSMVALITSDPKQRLTTNMLAQAFSMAAATLGNLFVVKAIAALGGGTGGYFKFYTIMGIGAAALILTAFSSTTERVTLQRPPAQKVSVRDAFKAFIANKWWMIATLLMLTTTMYGPLMSVGVYYFTWNMKNPVLMGSFMSMIYAANFGALLIATPIISRLGKINASFSGMFIQVIGGLLPLVALESIPVLMIAAALRGIGSAMLLGTRFAFMCDVVDYGEWKTGTRIEGLVFSGVSFGQKVGTGLGGALVAALLAWGGYVGGAAAQSEATLSAIRFAFTWVHAFCSMAIIICLFFLRSLDKQMPKILEELKSRREQQNTTA
ncbi:inner membrane symporter YicJ [Oxobacter pfennigii]|uniref:Inner membrane symporter YicJ n=1 Tax=Oxobacter pfennigii TaxID=36849 RepID=A0A0P8YXK6_9CLOT|nr:glycoside-pentoside-hexuronide (GPH):cation symporter [Oxobacter pfennigii]KPU44499.1 inner membrane symporter YicJ [Oxobacter pfennigii]